MASPNDRRYTTTHEWVMPDGITANRFNVGITAYRAAQLGTLTGQAFNVPVNTNVSATTTVCTLTGSTTAKVAGCFGGIERNEHMFDDPNTITTNPWSSFIHTVEASNPADYNSLMTAAQYDAYIGGQ